MARSVVLTAVIVASCPALVAVAAAAPPGAAADPARDPGDDTAARSPERLAASDCARARAARRPCVLTLDAEDVTGRAARGDGATITARDHATFSSLIRVRADFRSAIIRAADDL